MHSSSSVRLPRALDRAWTHLHESFARDARATPLQRWWPKHNPCIESHGLGVRPQAHRLATLY